MREEFRNNSGDVVTFTDEGIYCINSIKNRFYPYGGIDKIGFSLGSMDIHGMLNGEKKGYLYVPADATQKARIKELIEWTKKQMKMAEPADIIEIEPKKSVKEAYAYLQPIIEENMKKNREKHRQMIIGAVTEKVAEVGVKASKKKGFFDKLF